MQIFLNIDFSKFLDSNYIFEKTPPNNSLYLYLGILFGAFIILAVASWYWFNKKIKILPLYKNMRGRVFNFFLYIGIIGLFLIFCRYEGMSYLGSRLFMLILLWVAIIWLVIILNYRFRVLPKEIIKYHNRKNFEKYLPPRPKH